MTDKIVLFNTCDSPEEATRIAHQLVEQRLAACVNIVPGVRSVYRWKGQVEETSELLLIIKSSRELLPKLRAELQRMHSYEVPELVALSIVDGSPAYLEWMDGELKSKPG